MLIDGYIRVSTDEQASEGVSLEAQRKRISAYIDLHGEQLGIELNEIVEDAGQSGRTLDRPGWQAVQDRLRRGVIGGVVIVKLDRLTRSIADWNNLVDSLFCEKAGKRLFSVNDFIATNTAMGRAILNIMMVFAQLEVETISERTTAALRHKIDKGERVGKVRFGHTLAGDGKTLVPDDRLQEGILLMQRLKSEGLSLRQIAKHLEFVGIETADGKRTWHPSTVAKILKRTA